MSEVIEHGETPYKINSEVSIKSVIKGDYGFIKTIIFFTFVPFFLMSGAFQALQSNLLHKSLMQGEIVNMLYYRAASLFLLAVCVVYFALILMGLWRSAMQIKGESFRLSAKSITAVLALILLVFLGLLIQSQLGFLISIIGNQHAYPRGLVVLYLFGFVLLPYLLLLNEKQLTALGFSYKESAYRPSDNGNLAILLISFFLVWVILLLFLPSEIDADKYVFKGEPTFEVPNGYVYSPYLDKTKAYFRQDYYDSIYPKASNEEDVSNAYELSEYFSNRSEIDDE